MSAPEKAEVVTKASSSPLPKRKVFRELGVKGGGKLGRWGGVKLYHLA